MVVTHNNLYSNSTQVEVSRVFFSAKKISSFSFFFQSSFLFQFLVEDCGVFSSSRKITNKKETALRRDANW